MKQRTALLAILLLGNALAEPVVPVAGLQPDRRPPGAPVIASFEPSDGWQAQALKGIAPPQVGLDFLKDQGAWYTPFMLPGMPGRYDIRGLHAEISGKE